MSQPPNLVPAVDRAIRILMSFGRGDELYGVSDLSRMLELNKSTVFDLLNTLAHHRFLERDAGSKKYRLGPALFELGNLVAQRLSVREVARPYLLELVERVGATVVLGMPTPGGQVMIVDSAEPELELRITASPGSRIDHWAGVFGKIFHAALEGDALADLLERRPLHAHTSHTIVNPSRYAHELERVRAQGVATDYEEFLHGIRAVGVPINDHDGRVAAALAVMGFVRILDEPRMLRLTELLPAVGAQISGRLGATDYPQWRGTHTE